MGKKIEINIIHAIGDQGKAMQTVDSGIVMQITPNYKGLLVKW